MNSPRSQNSPAQSALADELWCTFQRDDKRAFATVVSNIGVYNAARILVDRLGRNPEEGRHLHLLKSKALRGVPDAPAFTSAVLSLLLDDPQEPETRILEILQALAPCLNARDLEFLAPDELDGSAVRFLADYVDPEMTKPVAWAFAAVHHAIPALLGRFKAKLSPEDIFQIWEMTVENFESGHIQLMLDQDVVPDCEEDMLRLLEIAVTNEDDQTNIVSMLIKAWPSILPNFKIPGTTSYQRGYWSGSTLGLLLENGAKMERERWGSILRWSSARLFAEQIDGLATARFNRWEERNSENQTLLEEVFALAKTVERANSISLIQKLLAVGAHPGPLLHGSLQEKLSTAERKLLEDRERDNASKRTALVSAEETQSLETDLQLV
jgi:hypothetical protein